VQHVISSADCIQCCFESGINSLADFPVNEVQVFYGFTGKISAYSRNLVNYLSRKEKIRSERFRFNADRDTYILSHGFLRYILSKKLNLNPVEIIFKVDKNKKPGLIGDSYYFNLTHSREAFSFAVSKQFYVGIDIEDTDQDIDILPIINSYFGKEEKEFILETENEKLDRFFLLWTRKEALLKAVGTGIVSDLTQISLSGKRNEINKSIFLKDICYTIYNEHYIYSQKIDTFFLSIAIPAKADIVINEIDENYT
jgi:4'-phosphopantetheinyl transferase